MRSEERGENRLRSFRVGKHDILVTREITNPSVIPPRKGQITQRKRKFSGKSMESAVHLKESEE